jgi:hypothetical protein
MHQGLRSIPKQFAGTERPRRSSVFRKTLIRAAHDVPASQFRHPQAGDQASNTQVYMQVSIGTASRARNAATRLAKALLKSAECVRSRSVPNASVRGRRVS